VNSDRVTISDPVLSLVGPAHKLILLPTCKCDMFVWANKFDLIWLREQCLGAKALLWLQHIWTRAGPSAQSRRFASVFIKRGRQKNAKLVVSSYLSYLSKVADFNLCWGWPPLKFAEIFGIRKLESLGYHATFGTACIIPCLAVLIQYRHVTDKQTDRWTHDDK